MADLSALTPPQGAVQTIGGWGAVGAGVIASLALLRRRLSRDRTEVAKDRAEEAIIEMLLKERDAAMAMARAAWQSRELDSAAIAALTAQNAYQAGEISRLAMEFSRFKRRMSRLYPETREFLETDNSPLPKA